MCVFVCVCVCVLAAAAPHTQTRATGFILLNVKGPNIQRETSKDQTGFPTGKKHLLNLPVFTQQNVTYKMTTWQGALLWGFWSRWGSPAQWCHFAWFIIIQSLTPPWNHLPSTNWNSFQDHRCGKPKFSVQQLIHIPALKSGPEFWINKLFLCGWTSRQQKQRVLFIARTVWRCNLHL